MWGNIFRRSGFRWACRTHRRSLWKPSSIWATARHSNSLSDSSGRRPRPSRGSTTRSSIRTYSSVRRASSSFVINRAWEPSVYDLPTGTFQGITHLGAGRSERARDDEVAGDVDQPVVGLGLRDGATHSFAGEWPYHQARLVGRRGKSQRVGTQGQPDEIGLGLGQMPTLVTQSGHHPLAFGDEGVDPFLELVECVKAGDRRLLSDGAHSEGHRRLAQGLCHRLVRHGIPHPESGEAVGLAEGAQERDAVSYT